MAIENKGANDGDTHKDGDRVYKIHTKKLHVLWYNSYSSSFIKLTSIQFTIILLNFYPQYKSKYKYKFNL